MVKIGQIEQSQEISINHLIPSSYTKHEVVEKTGCESRG